MQNVQLLLLAAGSSQRFKADKRWATMPDGTAIWRATLKQYELAGLSGIVIVRQGEAAQFEDNLPSQFRIIENPKADHGMESSRVLGLSALTAKHAMIALADMPFIQVATIKLLLLAQDRALIVQPKMGATVGHPKLFQGALLSELIQCVTPSATKAFLQSKSAQTLNVEVEDQGIIRDIDVQADLPT